MRKVFIAALMLPFAQAASAQVTGDAAAGKAYWERGAPRNTDCRDCHGLNGEGGFGPDLAGRGLNAAQVELAARKPWGIMPAFVESQLSAKDAADVAAYFASLPKPAALAPEGTGRSIAGCPADRSPVGRDFGSIEISQQTIAAIGANEATARRATDAIRAELPFLSGGDDLIIAGTPDECIARVERSAAMGITTLILSFGRVPSIEALELFAEKVMPAFR